MHLYLIRHGQSMGNIDHGYIAGRSDKNGLTTKGKTQITRTAWELRHTDFKTIYTSPVVRAKESATILHKLLKVPLRELPFIQEMSYGDFEGEYFWVNLEKKRESFERFNKEIDYAFPNGESLQMISDRVWNGWQQWLTTINHHEKSNIIFVSHDAIISSLLFILMYGHATHKHATASYKNAYMQFVHSISVENGSVFVLNLHANPVRFHILEPKTKVLPPTAQTISFYIRGVVDIKKPKIEEKITASENSVFHVSGSEDIIFKLIKEQEIVSSERIVSIYKYLRKNTALLIPEVLLYDKDNAFFSDTVLIQDYAPGSDQSELVEMKNCQKPILELTKDLLEAIHSIDCKDVEMFWYPNDAWHKVHVPWHIYMNEEIEETIRKLSKSIPDTEVRNKVRMILRRLREHINKQKTAIVPLHGDFAPQNIVITKDGGLRCLDFERARLGDRLWDYAYYYGWLQRGESEAAAIWKNLAASSFTKSEREPFEWYCVLFHAWTIRDILDYKNNPLRSARAKKSLKILSGWAGKIS